MKRWKTLAAIMASVAVFGGVAAGCSDSDSSEATTPASATTAPNTAVQTDAEGNTETDAPETPTEAAPPAETEGGGEEVSGDATAGKATFEAACQGCHANGGQEAGVGPKLAAAGLTADAVTTIVTNGQGAMPGGLVSGDDLENVTAYVLSIQ
jgi:mono/diheme cytochrome c family protein